MTAHTPIVVENLRLVFAGKNVEPLAFVATVNKLGLTEGRASATQFAVLGHEAKHLICEFQRQEGFAFGTQKYLVKLEAQLGDKTEWVELCAFSLNVNRRDEATINNQFLVHDNMTEF